MSQRRAPRLGFSLIEVAIVLLIIGLIVGAVLKGTELITSARLNTIQTEVSNIKLALATFQNKYGDLPGDIRSGALAAVGPGLGPGGNGDGRIGGIGRGPTATEATWAWQHLRVAGLLTGIGVRADGTLPPEDMLRSQFGGEARYHLMPGSLYGQEDRTYLMLSLGSDDFALTPVQLGQIDRRIDDGRPLRGGVRAWTDDPVCYTDADTYAPDDGDPACLAMFRL